MGATIRPTTPACSRPATSCSNAPPPCCTTRATARPRKRWARVAFNVASDTRPSAPTAAGSHSGQAWPDTTAQATPPTAANAMLAASRRWHSARSAVASVSSAANGSANS